MNVIIIFNTISFILSEFSNLSRAIRREQLFSVVMFSSTAFKILSNKSAVLLIACDYETQKLIFNRNTCKMCKKCESLALQHAINQNWLLEINQKSYFLC